MVWIHGGAFVFGSGRQPEFSGVQFARQGVVLVNFNYRLGRLGFFAFPALSREHPEELKGNYAYMDQIAALKWVQQNIAAFGGDPKNVTIFGESAGGVSVHTHLTSPLSRGLFQKAISQSGGARDGVLTGRPLREDGVDANYPVSAETIGVNFAKRHGIQGVDAEALAKLRALSVAEIVDGGQESAGPGGPVTYSGPILDGRLVAETAQSAYEAGRQTRVPLIIGANSADFVGFISADTKEALFSQFGERKAAAAAAYDPRGTAELRDLLTMAGTDRVQAEPARFTAKVFVASGVPAYVYRFSYVPAAMREQWRSGAPHGAEVPYAFATLGTGGFGPAPPPAPTREDQAVARTVNSYWANFAKTGDPNGPGLPQWPRYDPGKDEIEELENEVLDCEYDLDNNLSPEQKIVRETLANLKEQGRDVGQWLLKQPIARDEKGNKKKDGPFAVAQYAGVADRLATDWGLTSQMAWDLLDAALKDAQPARRAIAAAKAALSQQMRKR
jgi:para-nitrobenzyl esterase